jgi:DNA-binding NarL/FixJ family response regulator
MAAGDAPIRVLVADDHPVVRRGMTALLASLAGVEVVAEAATGAEAVREAQLTRPDVVVMDVQMPAMDGVEATRRLTTLLPEVAVLVLTMFEDDETVLSAIRAGARGYLLKGAEQDDILAALHAVVAGQLVVGPGVAARLVGHLGATAPAAVPFPELTPREREVLDRIARGQSNGVIATGLGLAPKTVGNHVSAIFAKLRVVTRAEAIVRAREEGLGGPVAGAPPGTGAPSGTGTPP